jgi:lysine-ketoglutarate reductase/saccharopine dehydrogenase-like protein (TIGR00300 family)
MMMREEVTLGGHIIDSQILSQVMDDILQLGGEFRILELKVGEGKLDRSTARIEVAAPSKESLNDILAQIARHGAEVAATEDVHLVAADMDGAFPEHFYSTTNQKTLVFIEGRWHEVQDQEMDCGIVRRPDNGQFRCLPISEVRAGDLVVVGYRGVKVLPQERQRGQVHFGFMGSMVSSEKPKNAIIRELAHQMQQTRKDKRKILLVAGPAIVHSGSAGHVVELIERGYVQALFAGNALAVHDIEIALFGTSLGIYLDCAVPAETGHEHHMRAINAIRRIGSIARAVEAGVLTSGIMHTAVRHGVEYVLAGSIRDDGPLPEVITDVLEAQRAMRCKLHDVGLALMVATGLHAIATGNMLPAWVPVVCVDINQAIATKLSDRGTWQTVGLVTDVEPFLRELLQELSS